MKTSRLFVGCVLAVFCAFSGGAEAGKPAIKSFKVTGTYNTPLQIVSDGANLWFVLSNGAIGQITTAGVITVFPAPTLGSIAGITVGGDGALWFTEFQANKIGRIDPTTKAITEFPVPTPAAFGPEGITLGPDGNVWFTERGANQIGRITQTGVITEFGGLSPGSGPIGIVAGPNDNALWFTEINGDRIGRMDATDGSLKEFALPAGHGANGITLGADGALWFIEADVGFIGRMTTSGSLTEFPVPTNFGNDDIVAGSGGNLWYASNQAAIVLVQTSNGVVTGTKKISTGAGQPNGITVGPDGHVWFTDLSMDTVNRLKKPLP